MSKIEPRKYYNRICPGCGSKKLKTVGVYNMAKGQISAEVSRISQTGFICDNCGKYHANYNSKWSYDRAMMRRDANNLLKFLRGKKK